MQIFSFFLIFFIVISGVFGQSRKEKKVSKASDSSKVWTKEEIQLFYQSWIVEDFQFPETLSLEEVSTQKIEPPKEESVPPAKKVSIQINTQANPIVDFFSENIKFILIGLAILSFALYRLRYGSSISHSSRRIFSKFKNK